MDLHTSVRDDFRNGTTHDEVPSLSGCNICKIPLGCGSGISEVIPEYVFSDPEGLTRFIKTIRSPEQSELIVSALRRQAQSVEPSIVEGTISLEHESFGELPR